MAGCPHSQNKSIIGCGGLLDQFLKFGKSLITVSELEKLNLVSPFIQKTGYMEEFTNIDTYIKGHFISSCIYLILKAGAHSLV